MSLMTTMLPHHLVDIIVEMKEQLETNSFDAFVEDFEVKVLAQKIIQLLGIHLVRYEHKLLVSYKPTNKHMIIEYDSVYLLKTPERQPCKHKVITKLCYDAINLEHTLQNKDELIESKLMSYSCMTQYKNEVFKLRKVVGSEDKFYRLLECYSKTP
jgi:hypothetical protein